MRKNNNILKLVETAMLMAVVIMLQLFASSITIGQVRFSFVLVPIVLGGILIGPASGAILGLTFGVITVIGGLMGEAFTLYLLNDQPVFTVFLCLAKATLAGLGSALLYRLLVNKNKLVATFVACASAPIINTGIFIIGALIMSKSIDSLFASAMGVSVIYFVVILCAGVNFLVEFAVNIIFAPALYGLSNIPGIQTNSAVKSKTAKAK